jgi:hypothetical protein
MSRSASAVAAVLGATLLLAGVATAATGAVPGTTWGTARPVGLEGRLTHRVYTSPVLSCPTPGNCAVAETTVRSDGVPAPIVATEVHGTWGRAKIVPGVNALSHRGEALSAGVSCGSVGNCVVGGVYRSPGGMMQPFVATEIHNVWRDARQLPGIVRVDHGKLAWLESLTCPSAGSCLVGGYYTDVKDHVQAFVDSQRNGTWGAPRVVPGTAALNVFGLATVFSVSCASPGNCAAVGKYAPASSTGYPNALPFVASEVHGTWRAAIPVSVPTGPGEIYAELNSVSCGSPGNCAAAGNFADASGTHAFVVSEANGTWGTATAVPAEAPTSQIPAITGSDAVACAPQGGCTVGGTYQDEAGHRQAFIVSSDSNGVWGQAMQVPGTGALNTRGDATVLAVSCASAGNCAVGGYYENSLRFQAFVATEAGGTWSSALEVPGTQALNTHGSAAVTWLSCPLPGRCAASGYYSALHPSNWIFVVSQR